MDVKSRREEYTEATRRALLDAAADLFATSGYAATSIEDVVSRARVTRGALYHHFRSKEDLFEAVYTELEEAAMVRIRRQDIEIPARIVFVVLSEAALGVAEADDRATARRQAFYLVRGVL